MKKILAVAAVVALFVTPATVYACSSHAQIADAAITSWLNGGSDHGYGNSSFRGNTAGRNALRQFAPAVVGNQSGGANNWNQRWYHIQAVNPFNGATIYLETTWGQLPDGWAIENFFVDTVIQWVRTFFDGSGNLIQNQGSGQNPSMRESNH